ncbi:hypothetical protein AQS70_19290 [Pseudomonas endophytica]|uniref:Glycine zipper 2TM domain-containing protein n=1 Tax=Pseudomonas endophytica TaxID=1563157 RepID=A0A0N8VT59_9PSED|nr:glycine zipper 2TM domain-containing protein [Pseudomonas endophytica]KQB55212.1 hypothetical protein AQS70_19290 [Pseudomonas endophytica]
MRSILSTLTITLAALILSACVVGGSNNAGQGEFEIRTGVIEQIELTQVKSNHESGVGAVLGGLAGAGIGSLIGHGSGRDVAMVAGALAGAVGGNYTEKQNYDQPREAQQIIVRMRSGVLVSVTQPVNPALAPGMNVYIEGAGSDARVVPQN